MRILVQDSAGKGYFDGVNWNQNVSDAITFDSVAHAENFCRTHDLTDALIVVKAKDDSHDISYPVGGRNALLVSKPATTMIKRIC